MKLKPPEQTKQTMTTEIETVERDMMTMDVESSARRSWRGLGGTPKKSDTRLGQSRWSLKGINFAPLTLPVEPEVIEVQSAFEEQCGKQRGKLQY